MDIGIIVVAAVGLVSLILLVVAIAKLSTLSNNVAYLAEQVQNAGMAAPELGQQIGSALDESLKQYMPKPDQVASSVAGSVDTAIKGALASVEDLQQRVIDAQTALLDKWMEYEGRITGGLTTASRAMEESAKQYGATLTGVSQNMFASFDEGAMKLHGALKEHAEKAVASCEQLTAQIERVAVFQHDVSNLLQLQQAAETTMKSVAGSEDFKELVRAMRNHLDLTDKTLKDLVKPRTIRLVESEQ